MKGRIIIWSGIAAAVVLIAVIAKIRPRPSHKQDLDSRLLGTWQELKSKPGSQTYLEFTRDGTIRVWEDIAQTAPPTHAAKFSIKDSTLVIEGEVSWAPRIRIEANLLAVETNSITWFKRRE